MSQQHSKSTKRGDPEVIYEACPKTKEGRAHLNRAFDTLFDITLKKIQKEKDYGKE